MLAAMAAGRAGAQPADGRYRIGMLSAGASPREKGHPNWPIFFAAMHSLGYEDGRNVVYDVRNAKGASDQVPLLARELVAAKPDLIVVTGTTEAVAANKATTSIPIVMLHGSYDPVEFGLAKSLARPRGNLTGMTSTMPGFSGKALELLIDALPAARRIGVLGNPGASHYGTFRQELEQAAVRKGATLLPTVEARDSKEIDAAFGRISADKPQALIVHHDALFFIERLRVIAFAAKTRLPVMYRFTEDVEAGGLMAFATRYRELYTRGATFVDKILKGAKPGNLPIEQPTRFGLWINLKTVKTLGITIPQSILLRADRVIE